MLRSCRNLKLGLLLGLLASSSAFGHDYWLEAERTRHGRVEVRLMLGPSFREGAEKATQRRRFAAARLICPKGETDLLPELEEGAKPLLALPSERCRDGALLALARTPARITLDHVKFNQYLRDESLVQAILDRTRAREMGRAGRERYTRFLKVLVPPVRGTRSNRPVLSTRPTGQTLEVVPEVPLESLRRGRSVPVRVLFENAPLPGVFVTLASRPRTGEPARKLERTDASGRATLQIDGPGLYALRLVHLRRLEADPTDFQQPEWESFWSSFVFRVGGR